MDGPYGPDLVGDEVYIDLNLDNFRDPSRCSLGLAVGQQHVTRGPDRDPARKRILDRWISSGICETEKASTIRAWCAAPSRFLDLKLVWQSSTGLTAKAYLGAHRSAA
jgi:hypothetical protein